MEAGGQRAWEGCSEPRGWQALQWLHLLSELRDSHGSIGWGWCGPTCEVGKLRLRVRQFVQSEELNHTPSYTKTGCGRMAGGWGGWGQKPSQAPGSCLEGWDLWVSPWRDPVWCSEEHRLESRSPGGCAAPLGPCDVCLRTSWGQQGGGGCT